MEATDYPHLNLPPAPLKIRQTGTGLRPQVFDTQRRCWVALTPEEWVRQHFVAMLVELKGYHSGSIANEVSIKHNNTSRRCDTVVYDRHMQPLMIVEYKAPTVEISQKTFDQIVRYNMVLRARYLTVSNGLHHYCCEIDYDTFSYKFLSDVPAMKSTQADDNMQ